MRRRFFILTALIALLPAAGRAAEAWDRVARTGELRWGADATGGAPYIFPDAQDPNRVVGFEVDLMDAVGKALGVKPVFVQVAWDQLVPALRRETFDMAFNGLEITPDRQAVIDFSAPYYLFAEQITVRRGDARFQTLEDFRGHRVGTLSASYAHTLLLEDPKIAAVPYPSPVEAYKDLELRRVEAVLMDVPIAAWYAGPNAALENVAKPLGKGFYAAGVRKDSPLLREKLNGALDELARTGKLERIYKHWNIWNEEQQEIQKLTAPETDPGRRTRSLWHYAPLLLKGAGMTVVLSLLSMALAVGLGFALSLGKIYGGRATKGLCYAYIEVVRGTPLLIQLYVIYYGLPNIGIQLNAFVAAVLGMGLNYAAYEAEIYRAGFLSVPKGQHEAAKSLGLTSRQTLWHVVLPQAVRTILPPSTNDFIALFKDTSLVSIITVTELTKAYSIASTATYRFFELGLATAALYFLMSFPLSLWSRHMERKRHAAVH